jgi:hypothetical protein
LKNILIVTKLHDSSLIPVTRDMALWLLSLSEERYGDFNV